MLVLVRWLMDVSRNIAIFFCFEPLPWSLVRVHMVVVALYVVACVVIGVAAHRWRGRSAWLWMISSMVLTPPLSLLFLIANGLKQQQSEQQE